MLYYKLTETKKGPVENRWPQFYSSFWDTTKTQEKNKTKLRKADPNSPKVIFFAIIQSTAMTTPILPLFFCANWLITYFFFSFFDLQSVLYIMQVVYIIEKLPHILDLVLQYRGCLVCTANSSPIVLFHLIKNLILKISFYFLRGTFHTHVRHLSNRYPHFHLSAHIIHLLVGLYSHTFKEVFSSKSALLVLISIRKLPHCTKAGNKNTSMRCKKFKWVPANGG